MSEVHACSFAFAALEQSNVITGKESTMSFDRTARLLAVDSSIPSRITRMTTVHGELFGPFEEPFVLTHSPGRIEGKGGHTDYNGGGTISVPINRNLLILARKRQD